MRAVVCGLLVKPAQPRRNDGRARRRRGPFDGAPLGHQARAAVRKGVSPVQAAGREELENGRDLYQGGGQWKYLYRAVDKAGNTVDFLLRARRDKIAARRYFEKAIEHNGEPETVTIDKSGANLAALDALKAEREAPFRIRQIKYLNNIVEQDHRAIKRMVRPMMGFKSFRCARVILSGIEVVHMIRKGQMMGDNNRSVAEQFYSLVI